MTTIPRREEAGDKRTPDEERDLRVLEENIAQHLENSPKGKPVFIDYEWLRMWLGGRFPSEVVLRALIRNSQEQGWTVEQGGAQHDGFHLKYS